MIGLYHCKDTHLVFFNFVRFHLFFDCHSDRKLQGCVVVLNSDDLRKPASPSFGQASPILNHGGTALRSHHNQTGAAASDRTWNVGQGCEAAAIPTLGRLRFCCRVYVSPPDAALPSLHQYSRLPFWIKHNKSTTTLLFFISKTPSLGG